MPGDWNDFGEGNYEIKQSYSTRWALAGVGIGGALGAIIANLAVIVITGYIWGLAIIMFGVIGFAVGAGIGGLLGSMIDKASDDRRK